MKKLFAALLLGVGFLLVPFAAGANTPVPVIAIDCAQGYHPQNGQCVANDLSATPTSGPAPLSVTFKSQFPGTVDFGDGTSGSLNPAPVCASCVANYTLGHTYTTRGYYGAHWQGTSGAIIGVTVAGGIVSEQPPPTCLIGALENSQGVGATVNLSWASSNATGGTINTIGSVGPKGTQGVIPIAPATTYTGIFTGPGGSATCSVTIAVGTDGYSILDNSGDPNLTLDIGDGMFYVPPYGGTTPPGWKPGTPPTDLKNPPGGGGTFNNGGLVSCGGTADCNICTFSSTFQNVINFLLGLSIPIAAGMFAYAGYLFFSNADNATKRQTGKDIFRNVLIGFIIALMAWLVIQTILKMLAPGYVGWNSFQCNDVRIGSTPQNSTTFSDVIDSAIGTPQKSPLGVINNTNSLYSCESGTLGGDGYCYNKDGQLLGAPTLQQSNNKDLTCPDNVDGNLRVVNGRCVNEFDQDMGPAVLAAPSQAGVGDCSPGNLSSDWGNDAAAMSCIAQKESSCNPGLPSGVDKGADGNAFSWGLYQINLTANQMQCPGQQPLNCPQAFQGRNFKAIVVDQSLYQQCVSAAQNIQCNTYTAQQLLYHTKGGIHNWSTAKACGY